MEWLAVAALLVVGLTVAAWLGQESMIFFRQPLVSTAHLPTGAVTLEIAAADGTLLRGWLRPADGAPAPTVLLFGGNAEEISWSLADRRWPRDWAIAAFNYRGYGASEGKPSEQALLADALVIHDAVAARPEVDARRIVVYGRSLGTGVAARVAAERPVVGAILASPYDSFVELGRTHYPWLPISLLLRHRFDAQADARRASAPLLAIVAAKDQIVPVERSRALFEVWSGPKAWREIAGADHNTLGEYPAFWQGIVAFLAERRDERR